MSLIKWLLECVPALTAAALFIWSYYVYVYEFCDRIVYEHPKKITFLFFFHIFFIMHLWSYLKIMCVGIATVPYEYKLPKELYETVKGIELYAAKSQLLLAFCYKRDLILVTRNEYGHIRFCNRCKHVKPDRAHHCIQCGTCVLKMDHHCSWVHNCIGFSNYKAFVLYLGYCTLYCAFIAGTTFEYFLQFIYQSKTSYMEVEVILAFVTASGLGTLLFAYFCFHMSIIAKNATTIETLREPVFRDNNENLSFDIGTCPNFAEVFGDNICLWLLPEGGCKGDGIHFPVRMLL